MRTAQAWGVTYHGLKPGPNEDRVLVDRNIISQSHTSYNGSLPLIIAVADGIGGDPGGDVAAQTALETIRGTSVRSMQDAMRVMRAAHANVKSVGQASAGMDMMCTTIAAVWIRKNRLVWCARGDTPIYLVTGTGTRQVTVPHTGIYGLLTSYLGADAEVTPDSTSMGIVRDEFRSIYAAAIVSDGVSKYVPPEEILNTLADSTRNIADIGRMLMHTASSNGSADNISFVMARLS